ncbi:MAG TPA: LysE family transporter [Opitutaceae bacterium]|nr:LysE family transporter [Opitutaceae bacterium]
MHFLLQGLVVGFIIASPIGPVGVLCIRRTLTEGKTVGLFTVLGAATVDAFYGMVAALGLTAVSKVLMAHQVLFRLGAGLFLLVLGIQMFFHKPPQPKEGPAARNLPAAYFSTLLLMLANPFIILSFLAVFAALGLHTTGIADLEAGWLCAGLFLGSAAWWLIFALARAGLKERLTHGGLRAINLAAGTLICGFGLWQFVELAKLIAHHPIS